MPLSLRAQAPGSLDPAYQNPATDNPAQIVVAQTDASGTTKAIIGGSFGSLTNFGNLLVPGFARFNADGTPDTDFLFNVSGTTLRNVTALALQPDGKFLVAGHDSSLNTSNNAVLLRFGADGTPDTAFRVTLDDDVESIAFQADGSILISGFFTTVNGTGGQRRLARLSPAGVLDTSFQAYTNNALTITEVKRVAVLPAGGVLAVTHVSEGDVDYLIQLDPTNGSVPDAPTFYHLVTGGRVYDLNVDGGGRVVIVGNFDMVDNHPRESHLARFTADGQLDTNFVGGEPLPSVLLQSVVVDANGQPLVGGVSSFTAALFRLTADTGVTDANFSFPLGEQTSYVQSLALQPDGALLVAGQFSIGQNAATLIRVVTGTSATGPTSANVNVTVPGTSNIWLAGAAAGTTASTGQDTLLNATPFQAKGLTITPGGTLSFAATGTVSNDPADPNTSGPDGATNRAHIVENGISSLTAPLNSLIGVFLDDSTPGGTPPDGYDFSGSVSPSGGVNFASFTPALRQAFFIGDGQDASGNVQSIVVPPGATRLFLGALDPSDQGNNLGSFSVAITGGTGGNSPAITSSLQATATVGQPFSYQITAGGLTPTSFVASGLPAGLTVDPGTGLISGTPTAAAATYPVRLIASDATGTAATAVLNLVLRTASTTTGPVLVITDTTISSTSNSTGTSAIPGDKITYGFTVRNTSNFDAANVVVTADLEGVKFKTVSDGGTIDDSTATWSLGTLAAHASRTLTATTKLPATIPPNGQNFFLAISSVTTTTANSSLPTTLYLNTKVLPPYQFNVSYNSNVAPGDTLRLTLTARNLSKAAVSGLSGSVVLPTGLKFLSITDENGASLGVKPDKSGNLTFPLPALPAGGSDMITLSLQINFDAVPGSTVTVSGLQATLGTLAFTQPDISVKLAGTPPANPPSLAVNKYPTDGDSLNLIFSFNPGAADALQAAFHGAIQFVANGDLNLAALNQVGSSFNPTVGVNADANDPDAPPFSVGVASTKVPAPYVTYALVCINNGTGDVSGVTVTDPIPDGFVYDPSAAQPAGDLLTPPYAFVNGTAITSGNVKLLDNGRTLQFKVGTLKKGEEKLILYQLQLQPTVAVGSVLTGTVPNLTAKELTGSVTDTFNLQYLVTGPAHAATEVTTPTGNFGALATFDVFYHNDGGKKTNDLKVLVHQPANALPYSARFLDNNHNVVAAGAGQYIEDALDANGNKVFHLGKVKPMGFGYVRITYQPVGGIKPSAVRPVSMISPDSFGATTNAMDHNGPTTRDAFHPRAVGGSVSGSSAGSFLPDDPRFARFSFYQHAPFAVGAGQTYQVTFAAMNLSDHNTQAADLQIPLPAGVDFVSLVGNDPEGTVTFQPGTLASGSPVISFRDIPPHTAAGCVLTLRAQAGSAGQTLVNSGAQFSATLQDFYTVTSNQTQTYVLKTTDSLPLLAAQIVSSAVSSYGATAGTVSDVAAKLAVQPDLGTSTLVNAAGVSFQGGGLLVPLGAIGGVPQVVVAGSPRLISQDGGGLIATGGGNLIATGGGNAISLSGQSALSILAGLISQDGGGVVASNQANILNGGGLNLISQDGGGLIGQDGGGLIVKDISQVVSNDGGSLVAGLSNSPSLIAQINAGIVSHDAGGLTAPGSGNLIATGGGNIAAAGGGNLVAGAGGNSVSSAKRGSPTTRGYHARALAQGQPAQGSPTNSVVIHPTDDGLVIVGGGKVGN